MMAARQNSTIDAGTFRTMLADLAGSREVTTGTLTQLAEQRLGVSRNMAYRYITGRAPVPMTVYLLVQCRLTQRGPFGG